jgi:hypothetical protein
MLNNPIDNIFYQMQTSILLNAPKTDNYYIDMFILPIIIGIFGKFIAIMKNKIPVFLKYIKNYFIHSIDNKLAKLEFEGQISYSSNFIKVHNDKGMSAFFYYIYTNQSKIKGIKYLKRIPDVKHYLEETNVQKELFEEFFIAQTSPIYLDNGVCIYPSISNKNDQEEDDFSKKGIKITKYSILVTYNKLESCDDNLKFLLDLYNKLKLEYLEIKESNINSDKQYVYMFGSKKESNVLFNRYSIKNETKKIEHMYFPEKQKFINEINFFLENKDYYIKKGKSYRKIILAYGEPGCGKTSLLTSLLNLTFCSKGKYPRQLIHLKLDKLTRKDLMDILFKETLYLESANEEECVKIPFDRRIYYIEEMDGYKITHKRNMSISNLYEKNDENKSILMENSDSDSDSDDNITDNDSDTEIYGNTTKAKLLNKQLKKFINKPTKDSDSLGIQDLLEALDGIPSMKHGEIIYMTTNHIDKIDDALKRPGRVNHLIHFKKLTKNMLIEQVETYYEDIIDKNIVEKIKSDIYTPAEIELICDSNDNIENAINDIIKKCNI